MSNNPEEGKRFLLAGLVALFVAAAGPAVLSWLVGMEVRAATATVVVAIPPPSRVAEEFPAEAWFVHTGLTNDTFCVLVDWGDGHAGTAVLAPGGSVNLTHNYGFGSTRPYIVRMYAWKYEGSCSTPPGGTLLSETSVEAVSVGAQINAVFEGAAEAIEDSDIGGVFGSPLRKALAWLVRALGMAIAGMVEAVAKLMEFTGISPGHAAYWLLTLPTPDMPGMQELWRRASAWMPLLWPLAAIAGALWRVFRDPRGLDLYDFASDMVVSLIVAVAGLALYAPLAKLYNAMVLSIAQLSQFNTVYSILLGHVVLGVLLGFNAMAAMVAWTAFMAILAIVVLGVLKWLAAGAIIGLAPIWASLYLFPPLRRAAELAANLVVKLAVLGLVAAGIIFLASMAPLFGAGGGAANLIVAYTLPIAVTLGGHVILAQLGLGGLPGIGVLRALRAARAAPAATGAVAGTALAGGMALATSTGPLTPTASITPTPTATAAGAPAIGTLATQLEQARQLQATSLALQIRKKWLQPKPIAEAKSTEPSGHSIEEIRLKHPRAAAVAAKAAEVGVKAASFLENRARGFAREFIGIAERELGIRIPERLKPRVLDKYDVETRVYRAALIGETVGEKLAEAGVRLGKYAASGWRTLSSTMRERLAIRGRQVNKMWS